MRYGTPEWKRVTGEQDAIFKLLREHTGYDVHKYLYLATRLAATHQFRSFVEAGQHVLEQVLAMEDVLDDNHELMEGYWDYP